MGRRVCGETLSADAKMEGIPVVRIHFQSIHIDNLADTSSVNKGTNRIVGRRHSAKINGGLGSIGGERNVVIGGKHAVRDGDKVDYQAWTRKS
ncbi:hypothetical protein [Bacillus sp. 3255]|uniref:hypothetical protein n=1 Tax=Bacillus sp. 3255 TaxID=2817904 RepID=UPI00286AEFB5|nr:hypothetical protein [Bacillus sp. 3255]